MTDGDSIAQVAVVILLLVLAVPALATANELAGTPLEYSEQVTVDYSTDSSVSESATVEGYSETVTITADGTQLVAGTDYVWNDSAGTVDWQDTTNTTAGQTASIEYSAYQRTGETDLAWTVISPLMGLFGLFGLLVSIRALWSFVAEVWTLG